MTRLARLGLALLILALVLTWAWQRYGESRALAGAFLVVLGLLVLRRLWRGLRRPGEIRYPANWEQLRQRVFTRDGHRCANCHGTEGPFHAHHIVPLSRGGSNNLSNIVTVCAACHALIHPHMRSPRD